MIFLDKAHASLANIFHVPWKEVGQIFLSEEDQAEWTNKKIKKVFSTDSLEERKFQSILDQGYSITVQDDGNNVRCFWLYKKDLKCIYGRVLQCEDAIRTCIDIFEKTIGINKPYEYEEWFGGKDKPYPNFVAAKEKTDSYLDYLLVHSGAAMCFSKTKVGYKLSFQNIAHSIRINFKKFN